MCGVIGIVGQEAAAPQLIDALKRLEYRGYDSAGVATLEDGGCRAGAPGQAREPEARLAAEPLRDLGIGHTRWATHGRPARTTPIRTPPKRSRSCTPASSRISTSCARAASQGPHIRQRDRHRSGGASRQPGDGPRRGPARRCRRPAAAARRVRARIPVRGEDDLLFGARRARRSPSVSAKARCIVGSDAIALAPFTEHVTYLEDGDWVIITALERRGPRRPGRGRAARDPKIASRRDAHRQGQSPPFHGQGDFRAARSRRPYAGKLHRHGG